MKISRRAKAYLKFLLGCYLGFLMFVLFQFIFKPVSHVSRIKIDQKLSQDLFNEVKIVCLVVTNPANHKNKSIHIKNTWGKKCNKLFFVTTQPDPDLDTIVVPLNESKNTLRKKIKESFQYVYENFIDDHDWMLKADDDR